MSVAVHAFTESAAAARALARDLGIHCDLVRVHAFPDGELLPTVPAPPDTVIVYRSLDRPNEKLIELALAAEAWRRLGARRLVLVAPYLAYMRQDTTFQAGQAISQRAISRWLSADFDRIVTVNAHLHRTLSMADAFPRTAAVNLSAGPAIADWLAREGVSKDTVVVGPDEESAPLVRAAAHGLGLHWLTLSKSRSGDRDVEVRLVSGNGLHGRPAVIIDDICSTGATLCKALECVRNAGAAEIRLVVVHPLFDVEAEARLRAAGASTVVSTDSIPHSTNAIGLHRLLAGTLAEELDR